MAEPKNILLIRLKSIGDVVFTLPAVNAVRERFPGARLCFLVSGENAGMVRGFKAVDEIIPLDRKTLSSGSPLVAVKTVIALISKLRAQHFDLAIDFQGYGETEWLSFFSGAPERWGNVYNAHRGWTYTRTSVRASNAHPAEWNLNLLRAGGIQPKTIRNEYALPPEPLQAAKEFFRSHQLSPDRPTLFLQPFTSNEEKNWPLGKFLELAEHFRRQNIQILFGGGPADITRLESARAAGFCIAAGTSLPVSAGLMQLSTAVVGADTGLLHLSTAMGRRVVMLMQSNHPGSCHPFQHPEWAVTSGLDKKVADIPLHPVIAACDSALT